MTRFWPLPFLILFAGLGAAASTPPSCTPAREGVVACVDGKLCECRFDPGGSLSGRPPGTRWNCGALRPACGAPVPPDAGQSQPPPPIVPMPMAPGWR